MKNRDPKSSKKSSPGGQHEPQERLRRSQERPKRPQDGPKSALRAARSAPRGAQEQPGAHQKGPKRDPGRPRSAKKPPGTPPGPILASFWGARGLISSNLAVLFEARARSARQSKTLFEITGQKVFCRFGLRLHSTYHTRHTTPHSTQHIPHTTHHTTHHTANTTHDTLHHIAHST